jgi:hypothetical protein
MTRLLIGNDFPEQLATASQSRMDDLAWWAQRILWHMRSGDILVLPVEPDPDCVDYVAELTGTDRDSLRIVVPKDGFDVLTSTRMAGSELVVELRAQLDGHTLDAIVPLCPAKCVADLALALGARDVLPAAGFLEQGGGSLANSKVTFRALAGGNGVPVPAGSIADSALEVTDLIESMISDGSPAMVKKDFDQGCHGNTIVSRQLAVSAVGASSAHVLPNADAVARFVAEKWEWLSDRHRHPVVVERYHPESRAIFAEFAITEDGVALAGDGELVAAPMPDGQILPAPDVPPAGLHSLREGGRRLSAGLHAIGYRGPLSADAILTVGGDVLFTEYNGRITGSTHIYDVIGRRVVGDMSDRVLVERQGWSATSFDAAVQTLRRTGLAYDSAKRSGVVLVSALNSTTGMVSYTVVAGNVDEAYEVERRLDEVSPTTRQQVPD